MNKNWKILLRISLVMCIVVGWAVTVGIEGEQVDWMTSPVCGDYQCCGEYEPTCNPEVPCHCFLTTEFLSVCIDDFLCDTAQECTFSTDCPEGHACITCSCCEGNVCAPEQCTDGTPFGTAGGATAGGGS